MQVFLVALQNLLAALSGGVVRFPKDSEVNQCVPVYSDLTTLYDANRSELEAKITRYLEIVRARWQDAQGKNLIGFLEQSKSKQGAMSSHSVQWLGGKHGLRGARISKFYNRLSTEQVDVQLAIDLVQQVPPVAVQLVTQDHDSLVAGVEQLRRLDDLLIRILAAKTAAMELGVPLAEILALYRTEGNLGVPRSHESLQLLIPPRESGDKEHTSVSASSAPHSPNLSSLVLLYDSSLSFVNTEDKARTFAVLVWMVHVAGLDIVAKNLSHYKNWSAENWTLHDGTMTVLPSVRQAVFDSLKASMIVEGVKRDATGQVIATPGMPTTAGEFLRVTPQDPELLISTILADAALFLRRGGRADYLAEPTSNLGSFPADWIAPARLTYAIYNLQVGTPGGSPKEAFIMSAVVHAERTRGNKFKELRDELHSDAAFKTKLKNDIGPKVKKANVVDQPMVDTLFPDIRNWLFHPTKGKRRFELLSHFIENADRRYWSSWDKHGINSYRGNANRYHLASAYYHLLTGESLDF